MGVPGLFRDLIQTTPLTQIEKTRFAHLLFDYNSLLYHALRSSSTPSSDAPTSDDTVIPTIIRYTSKWIRTVDASQSVYVAIDGPVPMAKMACQRRRRYKRVFEDAYRARVDPSRAETFDTTKFTPGTAFMDKFVGRLVPFLRVSVGTHVTVSDHHVPGEGEQKLMKQLRRIPPNEPVCIYGLDADLIVLSLLSDHPNLFLARDTEDGVELLSVEACRDALFDRVIDALERADSTVRWRTHVRVDRIIADLCFWMQCGGNDFVPGLFAWTIRNVGLDPFIETYARVIGPRLRREKGGYVIDETRKIIDWTAWRAMIDRMADEEPRAVPSALRRLFRSDRRRPDPNATPLERAMSEFNHGSFASPSHPYHKRAMDDLRRVRWTGSFENWSEQYRDRYRLDRKAACVEYLNALEYAWNYYVEHRPSCWSYVFPFEAAPLAHWFREEGVSESEFEAKRTRPYSLLTQLAFVIPPKCYALLPRSLRVPRTEGRMGLDYMGGKYIYAEPRMEMGGIEEIEGVVASWWERGDALERKRNRLFWKDRVIC